jgi:hypothetical protein
MINDKQVGTYLSSLKVELINLSNSAGARFAKLRMKTEVGDGSSSA